MISLIETEEHGREIENAEGKVDVDVISRSGSIEMGILMVFGESMEARDGVFYKLASSVVNFRVGEGRGRRCVWEGHFGDFMNIRSCDGYFVDFLM